MTTMTVEQMYETVATEIKSGRSLQHAQHKLIENGLDHESAMVVVRQVKDALKSAQRKHGFSQLLTSVVMCVLGALITMVSYQMASGGGTYFVTTGVFVVSAFNFVGGLWALLKSLF